MNRRNLLQALTATLASLPIVARASRPREILLPRDHNYALARLLDSGEPLRASIQQVGFSEDPWRPVEVDVFLTTDLRDQTP